MSHDTAFAQFRAGREARRAAAVRVTWRRVSSDTGGGWSGLGPNGWLVFVSRRTSLGDYAYGQLINTTRHVMGTSLTLARAKRAAERLLLEATLSIPNTERSVMSSVLHDPEVPAGHQDADIEMREMEDAANAAEGEEPTNAEPAAPTADSLVDGREGFTTTAPGKAAYRRVLFGGKGVAYANPRKDGVLLDFAAATVEGAPKKFQEALEVKAKGRTTLHVTATNAKLAGALLDWIAKQAG